jgi:hypothetical protein
VVSYCGPTARCGLAAAGSAYATDATDEKARPTATSVVTSRERRLRMMLKVL